MFKVGNSVNRLSLQYKSCRFSFKGRSALNDYGVDKIYNGDTIYVEGYNDAFKVTVYENDTIKYLPFI